MRVLFAGLGSIGQRHLMNLRRLGVDEFGSLRSRPAVSPPVDGVLSFLTLESALAWSPDAVLVCNPSSMHVSVALAAARANCHLFIEKPLSITWAGVNELIDEVRRRNLIALVGFNLRFNQCVRALESTLRSGRVGRLLSLRAQVGQYLPDWHPGEDYRKGGSASRSLGGGAIFDLIHELDLAQWLGGAVRSVNCVEARTSDLEIETEDVAEIILSFASGALGSVHVDYLDRAYCRTCRLICSEGTIVWDAASGTVLVYDPQKREWSQIASDTGERNDMYLAEMRHWLECLRGAEKPLIPLEEAASSLALAIAAHDSAASGRTTDVKANPFELFDTASRPIA